MLQQQDTASWFHYYQWQELRIIVYIIYHMYIASSSSIIKLIDNQKRVTDHETYIHTQQPQFQLHHCL